MSRILLTICVSLLLASASYAYTPLVIGNWETGNDGWGGWISSNVVAASPLPITLSNNVTYSQGTVGVTLGSDSLDVAGSGWKQSLAISMGGSQVAAFLGNTTFQIDVSVAASGGVYTAGYSEIDSVAMNAGGPGYTTLVSGNPITYYWWGSAGARTTTLSVDYTAFKAAMTESSWVQIVITTNTGGGAPADMYFDNARLTPEPATMALLGLGGLALIRRKR